MPTKKKTQKNVRKPRCPECHKSGLFNDPFTAEVVCTHCGTVLTQEEIVKKFRQIPHDNFVRSRN